MSSTYYAFDTTRDLGDKPFRSLCYAPELQLTFSPNGDASACCISRSHVLGNLRTERLDEIWHGARLREFRNTLRDYAFPSGCESCKWSLDAGNHDHHPIREFDQLGQFGEYGIATNEKTRWPVKLEFALSNTCNLGCVMCDGEYSSVLRAKEGLPPMTSAYDDRFFEDLARYLPHARWLSFLGGEPFLQKECYRIWDMLTEMDLAIPCHVTTNGTIYHDRVEQLLQQLPFNFNISVDGVTRETVERIRVNAKFDKLMENIRRINEYVRGDTDPHAAKRIRSLQLNYCVMQQNWHELPAFFRLAEELGATVWTVLVTWPESCSLFSVPKTELEGIVSRLDRETNGLAPQLELNRGAWHSLMAELAEHLREEINPAEAIVQLAPLNRAAAPDAVANHMERAWRFMADDNQEEALQAARRTAPTHSLYPKALCLMAEIHTNRHEFALADHALDQAITTAPNHPEAYLRRAWLRHAEGRYEEGLEDLERAQARADRLQRVEGFIVTEILRARGILFLAGGEPKQAIEQLDRYLALKPEDDEVRLQRDGALTEHRG